MPIRIPSPEALEEIRARTLACFSAARRCKEVRPANPYGPAPEFWAASEASRAAWSRLKSYFKESGAMEPLGWPDDVSSTLRKIALTMGGVLSTPALTEIPGLEDEVEALPTTSVDISSRKDARELARAGFKHATSGALQDAGVSKGNLQGMAKRALKEEVITDYDWDEDGSLWVKWKDPR